MKTTRPLGIENFEHWNLFGISILEFGALNLKYVLPVSARLARRKRTKVLVKITLDFAVV
jgi:hypothetical protein